MAGPGGRFIRADGKVTGPCPRQCNSTITVRAGLIREIFLATFPSGEGSDLAGVVEEVGAGVKGVAVGDER